MKRTRKIAGRLWLLALVMTIGFVACDDGGGGGNNDGNNNDGNNNGEGDPAQEDLWGDWVETTEPTLLTEGEETRTRKDDSSITETRVKALLITTTVLWDEAITQLKEKAGGEYTLTIGGEVGVAGSTDPTFGTTESGSSLSVTLKGSDKLYLTSEGNLINIGERQTLIIDSEDLTLQGLQTNTTSAVFVGSDGTLELKKGTISGNTAENTYANGGGVYVGNTGTFTMSGGEISGNTSESSSTSYGRGGGVYVDNTGTFTMENGKISGNTASGGGGGVYVNTAGTFTMENGKISGNAAYNNSFGIGRGGGVRVSGNGATFTMKAGEISGNTANNGGGGGGVFVDNAATFTMGGGKISGNTTDSGGGGVYVSTAATFTMEDGEISGNTANPGGGVYLNDTAKFFIVTGTIYGSNESNVSLRNTLSGSGNGAVLYRNGSGTAQRGTFTGEEGAWLSKDNLLTGTSSTNNTIKVKDGDNV